MTAVYEVHKSTRGYRMRWPTEKNLLATIGKSKGKRCQIVSPGAGKGGDRRCGETHERVFDILILYLTSLASCIPRLPSRSFGENRVFGCGEGSVSSKSHSPDTSCDLLPQLVSAICTTCLQKQHGPAKIVNPTKSAGIPRSSNYYMQLVCVWRKIYFLKITITITCFNP